MSYIYNKEPPTHGKVRTRVTLYTHPFKQSEYSAFFQMTPTLLLKVLLKTTLGDLDIELWSKETPLASRNFVQLCLEGYYNNTIFHRVVQGEVQTV